LFENHWKRASGLSAQTLAVEVPEFREGIQASVKNEKAKEGDAEQPADIAESGCWRGAASEDSKLSKDSGHAIHCRHNSNPDSRPDAASREAPGEYEK
jgi:hypothetical protein